MALPTTSFYMSESFTTNASQESTSGMSLDWKTWLSISEAMVYLILSIMVCLLVSITVYGTKTGRWWNRAGSSSLNNGVVFTAYVATTGLDVISLFVLVAVNYVSDTGDPNNCSLLIRVYFFAYLFFVYLTYVFFATLQRQILTHPSVIGHVNAWANRFSIATIALFTIAFIIVVVVDLINSDLYMYSSESRSCVSNPTVEITPVTVIGISFFYLSQIIVVVLTIYSAFTARFQVVTENSETTNADNNPDQSAISQSSISFNFSKCFRGNASSYVSPVQACVTRTARCACIILSIQIPTVIVSVLRVVPSDSPFLIIRLPTLVISLVAPFCMLSTFAFASSMLSSCVAPCSACCNNTEVSETASRCVTPV